MTPEPEPQAMLASLGDLRQGDLNLYERSANAVHEWSNQIPQAIAHWYGCPNGYQGEAAGVTLAAPVSTETIAIGVDLGVEGGDRTAWRCPSCGHTGFVPGILTFAAPSPDLAALRGALEALQDAARRYRDAEWAGGSDNAKVRDEWQQADDGLRGALRAARVLLAVLESSPPPAKPDAERLDALLRAARDVRDNPIDNRDRPSSWQAQSELVAAIDAIDTAQPPPATEPKP